MAGYIGKAQSVSLADIPDGSVSSADLNLTDGLTVDNDSATVATFDRATSDGTIVDLQKDGTAIGSIGAIAGVSATVPYICSNQSGTLNVGLRFDADPNQIQPCQANGADRDAGVSLGGTNHRFKDLYLSGGVYLGGTGAANKLEDYEEGTWTPAFGSAGGATGTTSVQGANYRKVGNLVVATCDITLTSKGTLNGADLAYLHGLPFSALSASGVGGGSVDLFLDLNQNVNTISFTSQGDTRILFRITTSEASSGSNGSWTNLFKNSTRMFLTITYLAA